MKVNKPFAVCINNTYNLYPQILIYSVIKSLKTFWKWVIIPGIDAGSLSIQGNHFYKGGSRVFLSGTNQAWVSYAYDFGNNQYAQRRGEYERILDELQQAGGNSIRK